MFFFLLIEYDNFIVRLLSKKKNLHWVNNPAETKELFEFLNPFLKLTEPTYRAKIA